MKKIMAIDYGDARTGIAISDLLCTIVGSTTVIHSRNPEKTAAEIARLAKENDVGQLVMGFPKNMDNSIGERGEKTLAFKERLERRTGLPVVLWDERLTTVAADQAMTEAGIRFEKRKEYVDRIAAAIILQGYLDYCRNGGLNLQ